MARIVTRGIYTSTLQDQARRERTLLLRLSFVVRKSLKSGAPVVGSSVLQPWSRGCCGKDVL